MKEYTIEQLTKEQELFIEANGFMDKPSDMFNFLLSFMGTKIVELTNKNIELEKRVKELEK
jgi:hypothetical protein